LNVKNPSGLDFFGVFLSMKKSTGDKRITELKTLHSVIRI
jgi:hypothetical protein